MLNYIKPIVGNRFIMESSEYEIIFISSDKLRYASIAGGGTKHLPLRLFDLYQKQKITTKSQQTSLKQKKQISKIAKSQESENL